MATPSRFTQVSAEELDELKAIAAAKNPEISTTQPLRCSSMTKQEKPCKGYAVQGETTCVTHTPHMAKRAQALATEASAKARRARVEKREELKEQARMGVDGWIINLVDANPEPIARSLYDSAVADGSSAAMREILNRRLGKVADQVVTTAGDPFAHLDVEELRRLAMGTPLEAADTPS